jgi:hypothetical protein
VASQPNENFDLFSIFALLKNHRDIAQILKTAKIPAMTLRKLAQLAEMILHPIEKDRTIE